MQNSKRKIPTFLYFNLLILNIACAGLFFHDMAAAEDPKEKYQRLQKEMEAHREKLEKAKKREHSVLEEVDDLNKKLDSMELDIKKQRSRIRHTESEISRVEAEISARKDELGRERKWMKRKLQALYRYGQSGDIIFLLMATDDMAELMRRWKYLERVTLHERKTIDGYTDTIRQLDDKGRQLQNLHASLKKSEEKLKLNEAELSEKRKEKDVLLASIRKEKTTHERTIKEMHEASKRLLEIIKKLEEKETYEAKGFSALKGKLPWPVNGRVAIPYGSHKDPKFNTPVFRNGIYIETGSDSVKSVSGGKIVFSDWFKGYGNLVIINHGEGYHTLYGNLSETFLKVGDIIKVSEVVGRVGVSGILNAPSLYFEVRFKGKPLDPMHWLKRR